MSLFELMRFFQLRPVWGGPFQPRGFLGPGPGLVAALGPGLGRGGPFWGGLRLLGLRGKLRLWGGQRSVLHLSPVEGHAARLPEAGLPALGIAGKASHPAHFGVAGAFWIGLLQAAGQGQVAYQQHQGGQGNQYAGPQPRGVVNKLNLRQLALGDPHGHKAYIGPQNGSLFPVDPGGPARLIGYAEKHQPVPGDVGHIGPEARAGVGEVFAGHRAAALAVGQVVFLGKVPAHGVQMLQHALHAGNISVLQHDGPQHGELPLAHGGIAAFGKGLVLAAG